MRAEDLRNIAIDWLLGDDEIDSLLGDDGDVIPAAIAKESEAVPRVSVRAVSTGSERDNQAEDKAYEVWVAVDATHGWVEDNQVAGVDSLKSAVKDALTTSRDGWRATGILTDDPVAPNDDINRYLGAVSFGFERKDTHAFYQET